MAIVTLSIPDELWQVYGEMDSASPQKAMEKQLERFKDFKPTERVLIFSPEERQKLEKLYGRPVEPLALIKYLEKLLTIEVAGVKIKLSETQVRKLVEAATYQKKRVEEYLEEQVKALVMAVAGA